MENEINTDPLRQKIIDCYTDSSSHQNQLTSWAFIAVDNEKSIIRKDPIIKESAGILKGEICKLSQIGGELTSICKAITWAKKNNYKINVFFDLEGALLWANGSWRCKNEWTRKYKKFVDKNKGVINSWVKVTAHSGNKYNEMVDKLAGRILKDNL